MYRKPSGGFMCALLTLVTASSVLSQQPSQGTDLEPGDMIRVTISGEDAMSGDYLVDETSTVSLPLLGARPVAGVPASQLRQSILDDYNAQFRNQSIQVTVLRRVSVLGAVRNPGLFHVDPTMTVGNVLALAGGATELGRADEVRILRDGREINADLSSPESLPQDLRSGDQLFVPERSWWVQNARIVIGLGLTATAIVVRAIY